MHQIRKFVSLTAILMCGIFGVVLAEPIKMAKVFRVLEKLEAHQYAGEPNPVGGCCPHGRWKRSP
jgi:hypothetical protein